MAERLTEQEIAAHMEGVPEWKREEKTIARRFRFDSFAEAIQFVNRVADIAEERNHHPFIAIDFKFVTLRLTSWHAGGLTADDFAEAALCDKLYEDMR